MKITSQQYASALYELTNGKNQQETGAVISAFVKELEKRKQLKVAGKIIGQFEDIYNKENKIVKAEVTSARELTGSEITGLKDKLKKDYGVRDAELVLNIDPRVVGGVKIKVGEEILDNTVESTLNRLRNKLV